MATITCTAREYFKSGEAVSAELVGYQSASIQNVVRYTFTTDATGASGISMAVASGTYASLGGGSANNLRFKITTSATSHTGANASSDYDGVVTMTYDGGLYVPSISATNVLLLPNTTYYLYIFTGSTAKSWYYWSIPANKVTVTTSGGAGIAPIYNGKTWDDYMCYIYNGSKWELYLPYVYSGSAWALY